MCVFVCVEVDYGNKSDSRKKKENEVYPNVMNSL